MKVIREMSFYEKYIKRMLDIICCIMAIFFFGWLFIVIAILVRIKLGSPIVFKQPRPGLINPKTGREQIFYMYKFRSMSDEKDSEGNLLPDEERMGKFGKKLRETSLDELLEVINILKGDMSIIGPRPQLVRDMVFMNEEVRRRHTARPGLSGLAQVSGRNAISWEEKFDKDIEYINNVSLRNDIKILVKSALKFLGADSVDAAETDVTDDYGDWLLNNNMVSRPKYEALQAYARNLIREFEGEDGKI